MLPRRYFPLSLAGLFSGTAMAAPPAKPIWVSHEIPPYLWQGANGPQGYAFHLFQRVVKQAEMGAELHLYPWARALRMLQAGQAEAALVMTRTEERESEFRWLFPVGRFRFAVFTRQQLGQAPVDLASLKLLRVGALRGSVGRSLLEPAGITHVVEGKDFVELLALLDRGIVEAVFGPEPVLRAVVARVGGEVQRIAVTTQGYDFYAVAGTAMSTDSIGRLQTAYRQLVDAGVVAQLRRSHPEALLAD